MSTQNRRSSMSSSTSLLKRQAAPSSDNLGKVLPHLAKKRPPLGNITNHNNVSQNAAARSSAAPATTVPCSAKVQKTKKKPSTSTHNTSISQTTLPAPLNVKSSIVVSHEDTTLARKNESAPSFSTPSVPCSIDVSPSRSDEVSASLDETMSICDSFKSPEIEYRDSHDVSTVVSIERKAFSNLCISEDLETAGTICSRDMYAEMEIDDKTANIDNNFMDPQLCATIACDIYRHLRASEAKKRPSTNFMERIQKDINASMRAILVDWLVEVAEEYRLVPDTLFLTVNYIDRFLSGNIMDRQRLQLLGVACMMIAAKYEEICAPQVEEFCYITDNTYFKEEVLQMESAVLNYLKFEMTAPTAKCFLRRFVRAAQVIEQAPSLPLECLANYIAELSLLEYSMLCYAPSLISAASIFLAKFIISPTKRPWNSTLQHYTLYQPSDLRNCVEALHQLCLNIDNSTLPAIREKYSQHKYKFVAKKYCPPSIPKEFFDNLSK
ncbi:cyclin-A1-1-like [Malania oleifera]|uniref:cyclin-A1-1-like n=1 Tax=Malania oleifera TaxID=397392 RepID=UPI0025AEA0B7|nr:cyclin-A1-1-like [Malania oleifera]